MGSKHEGPLARGPSCFFGLFDGASGWIGDLAGFWIDSGLAGLVLWTCRFAPAALGPLVQYVKDDGRVSWVDGHGWAFVYQNLLSVQATLDWITANGQIRVPEDSRRLVEGATHRDHLKEMADGRSPAWQALRPMPWCSSMGGEPAIAGMGVRNRRTCGLRQKVNNLAIITRNLVGQFT
jgi:hypothetical protein